MYHRYKHIRTTKSMMNEVTRKRPYVSVIIIALVNTIAIVPRKHHQITVLIRKNHRNGLK